MAHLVGQLKDGDGAAQVQLYCQWNQTATATGRLSSSNPNMQVCSDASQQGMPVCDNAAMLVHTLLLGAWCMIQAVTKYAIELQQDPEAPACTINIRDAFVATAGHVLLACDYSQVELRMLAHISGQGPLTDILQRGGDAFALIAERWLTAGGRQCTWCSCFCCCWMYDIGAQPTMMLWARSIGATTPFATTRTAVTRDQAKRVAYGIIYGQTATTLATDLGLTPHHAGELITQFMGYFGEVRGDMCLPVGFDSIQHAGALVHCHHQGQRNDQRRCAHHCRSPSPTARALQRQQSVRRRLLLHDSTDLRNLSARWRRATERRSTAAFRAARLI